MGKRAAMWLRLKRWLLETEVSCPSNRSGGRREVKTDFSFLRISPSDLTHARLTICHWHPQPSFIFMWKQCLTKLPGLALNY